MCRPRSAARTSVGLVLVALLLAATVTACGSSSRGPQSGLQGRVRLYVRVSAKPARPHLTFTIQPGMSSPYHLLSGPISLTVFDKADTAVTTLRTQADGRFQVALAPGSYYILHLWPLFVSDPSSLGLPFASPRRPTMVRLVVVRPGHFTNLDLKFFQDLPGSPSQVFVR